MLLLPMPKSAKVQAHLRSEQKSPKLDIDAKMLSFGELYGMKTGRFSAINKQQQAISRSYKVRHEVESEEALKAYGKALTDLFAREFGKVDIPKDAGKGKSILSQEPRKDLTKAEAHLKSAIKVKDSGQTHIHMMDYHGGFPKNKVMVIVSARNSGKSMMGLQAKNLCNEIVLDTESSGLESRIKNIYATRPGK